MDFELLKACATIRRSGQVVDVIVKLLGDASLSMEGAQAVSDASYAAHTKAYAPAGVVNARSPAAGGAPCWLLHTWRLRGNDDYETDCGLKTTATLSWLRSHHDAKSHYRQCPRCSRSSSSATLRLRDLELAE